MQQYLIIGLNAFGAEVIERLRALPVEQNVVYRAIEGGAGEHSVAGAYLSFRQQMLDLLNREVFNFANTPLTIYLVGLLTEEDMADNLMRLGYLFKSFFRENIILSPRVKVVTACPTIIPEEAYAWLPRTRRTLDQIDTFAALKEQFRPAYAEVRRPNLFGDVTWCKGKVTRKYDEAGEHLVDLDVWAENHRGEITAPGKATVALLGKDVPGGHKYLTDWE